jgi:hypothetical protein
MKHVTELSTSSAEGIAVANQVTPERLARLLMSTGPLAIRHITSNLSKQIQGFEKLSLSKQRRLIMSCLNQGYEEEAIVFEKIGWGQWRAKQVTPDDFIKERNAVRIANAKVKENDSGSSASANARRESITKNKYELDNHDKLLNKKSKMFSNRNVSALDNDYAIASDDEEEQGSLSDSYSEGEDMFKFDDEDHIPPLKLNSRLISPPTGGITQGRKSSMSRVQKPRSLKPHRSNSQTPTSPELLYYQSSLNSRRHSSIRSTLTHDHGEDSETDEEDWETIGALQLLKREPNGMLKQQEQDAAFALVNLRSI